MAIATALKNVSAEEGIEVEGIQLAEPHKLSEIKKNFDAGIYGVDVAIDINHDHRSGAAAWIKELEIGPSSTKPGKDALFARVEWTDYGREMVGRYKYISAQFGPHTDPETGNTTQDVLKAATLTNRPFVKGMQSVSLESDRIEVLREGDYVHPILGDLVIQAEEPEISEDDHMELHEVLETLGIQLQEGEDAATKLAEHVKGLGEQVKNLEEQSRDKDKKLAEAEKKLAAAPDPEMVEEKDATLEELQGQVTQLSETVETLQKGNKALEMKLFEAERDAFFETVVASGRVLPKEVDGYKRLYAADKEGTVALIEAMDPKVDLETHGSDDGKEMSLEEKILAKADELMAADSDLSDKDALMKADAMVRGDK